MIKLSSVITDVVNTCFTQEERDILAIRVGENVVSPIDKQFMRVYRNRCYFGTKEDLIQDFMGTVDEYRYYILRIRDIQKNMALILIPGLYNDVKYIDTNHSFSNSNVSTGSSNSNFTTDGYDVSTADSGSVSANLGISQSGASESNDVDKIDDILRIYTTDKSPQRKFNLEIDRENKTFTKTNIEEAKSPVPSPSVVSPKQHRVYQNLTFDQSNTFDTTQSSDSTISATGEKRTENSNTSHVSTEAGRGKRGEVEMKVNENLNRIKAWRLELRSLRQDFIHKFDDLFHHAERY